MVETMASIYALLDPRDQAVRYVGKTSRPLSRRLRDHIWDCRNQDSYRANWVKKLLGLGLKPLIFLLEEVPDEFWEDAENFWIAFFRSRGARLTNTTTGGMGGKGMTASVRAKLSAALKGKPARNKGKKASAETLAKMSAVMKGNTHRRGKKNSPEQNAKHSAFMKGTAFRKGKKASAETRARVSEGHKGQKAWNKGVPMTDEARAHLSEIQKGKRLSPEHRAKISASLKLNPPTKGKKMSAETKAKISAAKKGKRRTPPSQLPLDL